MRDCPIQSPYHGVRGRQRPICGAGIYHCARKKASARCCAYKAWAILAHQERRDRCAVIDRFGAAGPGEVPLLNGGAAQGRMDRRHSAIDHANRRPAWEDNRLRWGCPFGVASAGPRGSGFCSALRELINVIVVIGVLLIESTKLLHCITQDLSCRRLEPDESDAKALELNALLNNEALRTRQRQSSAV